MSLVFCYNFLNFVSTLHQLFVTFPSLANFTSTFPRGRGAWGRAADASYAVRRAGVGDQEATVVVITGTVAREAEPSRAATAMLITDDLVDPFAAAPMIGFVVPRAEFVDLLSPDVPFELGFPASYRCAFLLDAEDLGPGTPTGTGRILLTPTTPPAPGEHVLTVVCLGENDSMGAVAVLFQTTP